MKSNIILKRRNYFRQLQAVGQRAVALKVICLTILLSIEKVELLGAGKLDFKHYEEGLKISLPAAKPCEHAYALKISGHNLV